jgi:MFS family permease
VLVTTGSPAAMGVVSFVSVLAEILGGLFGGTIIDRLGPRQGNILLDLAGGLAVAAIPLLHATVGIGYWGVAALVGVRAFFDSPGITARASLIPELARAAGMDLARANSIWHGFYSGARLVGAPVAGVLITLVGAADVLWLDAASFWCSALLVAVLVPASLVGRPEKTGGTFFGDLREGLEVVFREPIVRAMALAITLVNFLWAPVTGVYLPVYASQGHGGSTGLGLLLAAVSAGNVTGLLLYGAVARRLPRRPAYIGAFMATGLTFWALAVAPGLPVAAVLLFVANLLEGPLNPIFLTVIHERVAPHLHGRIIGAARSVGFAVAPLGSLAGGAAVQGVGLEAVLLGVGITSLVSTSTLWLHPVFHGLEPQAAEAAPQPTPERG